MTTVFEEPLTEADAMDLPDGVLVRYVSGLWADPDLRTVLEEHSHYLRERLRAFGRHGYLLPQDRQGLCKVLFAGSSSVQARVLVVQRRRSESAREMEHSGR